MQAADPTVAQRLSATEIERILAEAIRRWFLQADDPFAIVQSVHLSDRGLQLKLEAEHCTNLVTRLVA